MKVSVLNLRSNIFHVLENEPFENFYAKSTKEEGWRCSVNSGKIRYLRRDPFLDDPLANIFSVNEQDPNLAAETQASSHNPNLAIEA